MINTIKSGYNQVLTNVNKQLDNTALGDHYGKFMLLGALGLLLTGAYQLVTLPVKTWYTGKPQQYEQSYIESAANKVREAKYSGNYPTIENIVDNYDSRVKVSKPSFLETLRDKVRNAREDSPSIGEITRNQRQSRRSAVAYDSVSRTRQRFDRQYERNSDNVVTEDFDDDGRTETYRVNGPQIYHHGRRSTKPTFYHDRVDVLWDRLQNKIKHQSPRLSPDMESAVKSRQVQRMPRLSSELEEEIRNRQTQTPASLQEYYVSEETEKTATYSYSKNKYESIVKSLEALKIFEERAEPLK